MGSSRVRASYEQIVLQMLKLGKRSEIDAGYHRVFEQATRISEWIAELEARLTTHNQAVLFEQLARLDAQLARLEDADKSAEIIEQKVALTEQLRTVDAERREIGRLAHELAVMASDLPRHVF